LQVPRTQTNIPPTPQKQFYPFVIQAGRLDTLRTLESFTFAGADRAPVAAALGARAGEGAGAGALLDALGLVPYLTQFRNSVRKMFLLPNNMINDNAYLRMDLEYRQEDTKLRTRCARHPRRNDTSNGRSPHNMYRQPAHPV